MFFSRKKILGLDIGTSSIKLAEVDKIGKKATLVSFGVIPTPQGAVSDGEVVDPDSLQGAISELVSHVKTKRKLVSFGVWGTGVVVKKISLPIMERSLLDEQIKWEAEQYIPFDINAINLDYHVLKQQQDSENLDILLIAAQKDFLFKFAEVLEMGGLQAAVIDVNGFALANCYEFNYGKNESDVVALINMGAGVTNFVVLDGGEPVFTRDVPVGGLNYTNDIHNQLGVSIDEAESLKMSAASGQAVPQEVIDIIESANESMADELSRSIDFFSATISEKDINKVFVTGGSIAIPGIFNHIERVVGTPPQVLNPFQKVGYKTKTFSDDYINQISNYASVAIGLALRGLD